MPLTLKKPKAKQRVKKPKTSVRSEKKKQPTKEEVSTDEFLEKLETINALVPKQIDNRMGFIKDVNLVLDIWIHFEIYANPKREIVRYLTRPKCENGLGWALKHTHNVIRHAEKFTLATTIEGADNVKRYITRELMRMHSVNQGIITGERDPQQNRVSTKYLDQLAKLHNLYEAKPVQEDQTLEAAIAEYENSAHVDDSFFKKEGK